MPDNRKLDHHLRKETDRFVVTFHPAFASLCELKTRAALAAEALYRQGEKDAFPLKSIPGNPKGEPVAEHCIHLRSKTDGREVLLTLHDPDGSVARITVEWYDEKPARRGARKNPDERKAALEGVTTFTFQNDAETCPPTCDDGSPPG
jgi:hypothetical protein